MSQSATFGHRPGSGADRSSIVPLGNHDADKPKLGGGGGVHVRAESVHKREGRAEGYKSAMFSKLVMASCFETCKESEVLTAC